MMKCFPRINTGRRSAGPELYTWGATANVVEAVLLIGLHTSAFLHVSSLHLVLISTVKRNIPRTWSYLEHMVILTPIFANIDVQA